MIEAPDQCFHEGKYGTWKYLRKLELPRDPGFIIETEYVGHDGRKVEETVHTRDKDDWSAPAMINHSDCSWCWLGHGHTVDECERSRHVARTK